MSNKKGKSKRSVRCTLCTQHRWRGNAQGRFKVKDEASKSEAGKEIRDLTRKLPRGSLELTPRDTREMARNIARRKS